MNISKYFFIISIFFVGFIIACDDGDENPSETASFDRREMLTNWADNIIVPAFINYRNYLQNLVESKDAFILRPNESTYDSLTAAWLQAYKTWQHVSMFDIGKAESIGLRNFTNIYPADNALINENISSQVYNLELPSNFDAQGFPAIDYLLFGIGGSKEQIIEQLSSDDHSQYLSDLINRLHTLTDTVTEDWLNSYSEEFINNDGSSATASVDKVVNDFLFYYEKYLRAGKVGIPAGVFSGNKISSAVEAPYSGIHSKLLFLEGLEAVQNFFLGNHFEKGTRGISLKDYLDFVRPQNNDADIAMNIVDQWGSAISKTQGISDNLKEQVETDNVKMLELYDELQIAVVLMKVDMMQALNIQVDYVDADGD